MSARFELHGMFVSGPTYKVGLMLSLSGEAFDYIHVNLMVGEHKQPPYLAKQRFGQVPLLVDKNNGRHLCQSAAILEYLADTLGKFGGATLEERIQAREWLYWDFERLATPLYRARLIRAGFFEAAPGVAEDCSNAVKGALTILDQHLAGRNWLVGEGATIADIDIYGVVAYAGEAGFALSDYPHVEAWAKRMEALPGFAAPSVLLPQESRAAA